MPKEVNIAMTTYNRLEYTKHSIESILEKTKYPYILTVVDNNSTDGSKDYLRGLYEDKKIQNLLLLPKNLGVSAASNLGWQMEDTEYYLKYDNDMKMLKEGWLVDMIDIIDNVPKIGVIGYNVESIDYPIIEVGGYEVQRRLTIGGACILIPKRVWSQVGYWSEDYGMYAEEDTDYGIRVARMGWLCPYMKDKNAVIHLQGGNDHKFPEYREFKDDWREKNKGKYMINMARYAHVSNIYVKFKTKLEDYKKDIYK